MSWEFDSQESLHSILEMKNPSCSWWTNIAEFGAKPRVPIHHLEHVQDGIEEMRAPSYSYAPDLTFGFGFWAECNRTQCEMWGLPWPVREFIF